MAQDDWKWYREPLIAAHDVGMTYSGCRHLDQDFTRTRIVKIDLFDYERPTRLAHYCCCCSSAHALPQSVFR